MDFPRRRRPCGAAAVLDGLRHAVVQETALPQLRRGGESLGPDLGAFRDLCVFFGRTGVEISIYLYIYCIYLYIYIYIYTLDSRGDLCIMLPFNCEYDDLI